MFLSLGSRSSSSGYYYPPCCGVATSDPPYWKGRIRSCPTRSGNFMPAIRFAPCIIGRIPMNPTDHLRSDQKFPPREATRSSRTNSPRRTDAQHSRRGYSAHRSQIDLLSARRRVGPKAAVDGSRYGKSAHKPTSRYRSCYEISGSPLDPAAVWKSR